MRSSASKFFAFAGVLSLFACSSSDDGGGGGVFTQPTGGGTGGTANIPAGGTATTAGTTNGGAANGGAANGGAANGGAANGGTGGVAGGAGGATGGAPAGGGGAGGDAGGTAGAGGAAGGAASITAVWPSAACGVATAPNDGMYTIDTTGVKTDCARQPCIDDWSETREYSLYLPDAYDNTHPYTLLFEGPGCGGNSESGSLYNYENNANNTVVKIGVRPSQSGEIQGSHGTNPNQGCFDDKEGDDSVDFVLYEDLYDLLDTQICFDKNRVFFGGNSSGAWWSNEHGCHYAGDAVRPVRGIAPNTGGLPQEPQFKPTCTTSGMAGMWVHNVGDETNPFSGNIYAIDRAMSVNGCVVGQTYETATFENYPIPGVADNTCGRIVGCDALFPLVVCALPGGGHGSHPEVVNPGVSLFLQSFLAAPLAP